MELNKAILRLKTEKNYTQEHLAEILDRANALYGERKYGEAEALLRETERYQQILRRLRETMAKPV